ncbi:MAG: hypothetical protein O8C64_09955 [Candidatus Methanoperedens sp.]|nr:hypothetical protein [Candidatus Methanoperedens sp.]MCZ7405974.1 hypothetical protein [Candidatus Methanoperedens sp.]
MLSEHAKEIIKDVNDVGKKRINIDDLLQRYPEKPERDFIQKYAETEIASSGLKVGRVAFYISLAAAIASLIIAIAASIIPDFFKDNTNLFSLIILLYFVVFVCISIIFIKETFFGKDIFKQIILEIEDIKMPKKPTCYFSNKNLYRTQKLWFWYMQSIKERFKDFLYLEREDRKRLIELILLVGSILVALKTPQTLTGQIIFLNDNKITEIFMLFILLSIYYFILIQKEVKEKNKIWVTFIGVLISAIFSAIMAGFLAISVAKEYPTPSSALSSYFIVFFAYWLSFTIIIGVALREK